MINKYRELYKRNKVFGIIQPFITITTVTIVLGYYIYQMINHNLNSSTLIEGLQALCTLIFVIGSYYLKDVLKVAIPDLLETCYLSFAYIALVGGNIFDLYSRFEHFDSFLHFFFGVLIALFGYVTIDQLAKLQPFKMVIHKSVSAILVVMLALSVSSLWEMFEYFTDDLLDLNNQVYRTSVSELTNEDGLLLGHEALSDTIWDMFLGGLGAFSATLLYNKIGE